MSMRAGKWVKGAVALGLAAQSVAAGATLITQQDPFSLTPAQVTFQVSNDPSTDPPTVTNINNGPKSATQLLSFSEFNSALGTLNSVTISFATNFSGTSTLVSVVNNGDDSVSFFADGSMMLTLTGGLIPTQMATLSGVPSGQCIDVDTGGTCTHQAASITGTFGGTIPGLSAASFIGLGTFDLTSSLSSALAPRVDPDNGTGFADNATFNGTLDSAWAGSVTVVYDYDPQANVPEPLPLYLLVAGLGALALMRRRRA